MEHDAVLFVERADEVADSGPSTRSSGRRSGRDDVDLDASRARSAAATSRPMKLAPMTTARCADFAVGDDRAAVGERAQHVDVRHVRARDIETDRLGARGEQQLVERQRLTARQA